MEETHLGLNYGNKSLSSSCSSGSNSGRRTRGRRTQDVHTLFTYSTRASDGLRHCVVCSPAPVHMTHSQCQVLIVCCVNRLVGLGLKPQMITTINIKLPLPAEKFNICNSRTILQHQHFFSSLYFVIEGLWKHSIKFGVPN